jgi:hypothetical protein
MHASVFVFAKTVQCPYPAFVSMIFKMLAAKSCKGRRLELRPVPIVENFRAISVFQTPNSKPQKLHFRFSRFDFRFPTFAP